MRLDRPGIYAFIQVDGTGGGLVHRLGEIDPDQVYIGLPVEAVFLPKERRAGSVLDISYLPAHPLLTKDHGRCWRGFSTGPGPRTDPAHGARVCRPRGQTSCCRLG
ncbi:MAG: OB-fold domain-containing protein [Bacillota bacterium]